MHKQYGGAGTLAEAPRTRCAAFMFVAAGLADLATRGFPTPSGVDASTMVTIDLSIIVGGAALFVLPWHRWPRRALLVFVPIALGSVVWRNWALGPDNATYSMYFVVAAAWIGVTFRPGTSIACSPVVAAAYVAPLLIGHEPLGPAVGYLAVTVSVCAVMGEALAWLATRLRAAEQADVRRLQDMQRLVAASEELARGIDGRDAAQARGDSRGVAAARSRRRHLLRLGPPRRRPPRARSQRGARARAGSSGTRPRPLWRYRSEERAVSSVPWRCAGSGP